jgi:hypothetical protein
MKSENMDLAIQNRTDLVFKKYLETPLIIVYH